MNFRRASTVGGLLLAMFFSSLDRTVVATAMPRITADLNGIGLYTWLITVYLLTSTVVMPVAGKFADLFGRRTVFTIGVVVFMAASGLCGSAATMVQLISFRAVQGLGAGMTFPTAQTIVGDVFRPPRLGRWQGILVAVNAVASLLGPPLGGWIVDTLSWRWAFYVNMPFALIAAACLFFGFQGEPRRAETVKLDWAGTATFTVGTAAFLLGLNAMGGGLRSHSPEIAMMFIVTVVALAWFVLIERKAQDPILDLHLFRRRELAVSSIEAILVGVGLFGAIVFIPLYLQGVVGLAASRAGTAVVPMMLAIIVASVAGGQLSSKISYRTIFALGFLLVALGFLLPGVMVSPVSAGLVIAYTVLLGFGIRIIFPTTNTVVQEVFPYKERGVATSAVQLSFSVGAILGIAAAGVILNVQSERLLERTLVPMAGTLMTETHSPANAARLASMIELAKNDPQQLFSRLIDPEAEGRVPDQLRSILLPPLRTALARSLSLAFFVAMFAALLGIVTAFWLGNRGITGRKRGSASKTSD